MRRSNVAFGGVMDHLTKMPPQDVSSVNFSSAQTEKPQHYTWPIRNSNAAAYEVNSFMYSVIRYLKEFRTQQCPEFLQHKCTRHRPYTCFHWHFVNQKRRRPVKRRDGTFNYSGDIYCQKYDETSGICPDGDDCPLLHRVAGDAERRYHLRYYKTCHCVHETDSRGQCTKNGQHCAFAHGADDIRNPVFEDGEEDTDVAASGAVDKRSSSIAELSMSLEKDILCNEDPTWNDMHYVLAQYKTEVCRRPHRLCRQGYACPSYHNLRDKRRSPLKFKYRSTPCPSVKHGDEWGDPSQCDNGDECSYCHTRTEQQFHPEIYKSTKCNDMVQTGYCPRGPFCAFAHVEQEMNAQWDIPLHVETSLAAFVCNALPGQTNDSSSGGSTNRSEGGGNQLSSDVKLLQEKVQSHGIGIPVKSQSIHHPSVTNDVGHMGSSGWVDPMQGCASSVSSDSGLLAYHKAPGCERENAQLWTRRRASTMEAGVDAFAHHNRAAIMPPRHGIPPLMHSFSLGSPGSSGIGSSQLLASVPRGTTLYSSEETVESVIGNALDEDVGRLNLASLGSDLLQDDADSNDVCSPLSTSFSSITASGHFSALSSSGLSAEAAAAAGLTLQNYGQSPVTSYGLKLASLFASSEPSTEMAVGFANSLPSSSAFGAISPLGNHEVQRLKEELAVCNMKLLRWKEGIAQARNACEAWRKEAEDWSRKTKKAEEEKQLALRQRDEAIAMVARLRQELEGVHGGSMHCAGLQHANELDYLPPARLQQMHGQLQHDLDRLEKVMKKNIPAAFGHCCVCKERKVNLFPAACQHCVVCVSCATQSTSKCPICWSALLLPTSSNIVPS